MYWYQKITKFLDISVCEHTRLLEIFSSLVYLSSGLIWAVKNGNDLNDSILIRCFSNCRYSDEGKWLGTFDFRFDTKNKAFNLEKLYPLNKFNATSGYVYISLQNSVVKLVDQYLVSVAEKEFLGMITSHSVLNGSIGICTVINPLTPFTMCSILNSSLVIKRQYVLPNNLQKYDWKIFNLADKSSLAVSIPKQLSTAIEVKRLAPNGKTSLSHYFDLKNCESDYNPLDKFDELPGNYCFAFNCFSKSITDCLDSSKTVNLTILSNWIDTLKIFRS